MIRNLDWPKISMAAFEALKGGDHAEARLIFLQWFSLIEKYGPNDVRLGYTCWALGKCYYADNKFELAAPYFRRAAKIYNQCDDLKAHVESIWYEGLCYKIPGKFKTAARTFLRAISSMGRSKKFTLEWRCNLLVLASSCYASANMLNKATDLIARALSLVERTTLPESSLF